MAGLEAGLVHGTWPLMDGALIPALENLFILKPVWLNFVDNPLTVQFVHRTAAYLLVGLAVYHAADCARYDSAMFRAGAIALAFVLSIQAMLGIATLLLHVPLLLALAHQAVAMLALVVATVHVANLRVSQVRFAPQGSLRRPATTEHAPATGCRDAA